MTNSKNVNVGNEDVVSLRLRECTVNVAIVMSSCRKKIILKGYQNGNRHMQQAQQHLIAINRGLIISVSIRFIGRHIVCSGKNT
jgi:hypothetical protein